MKWLHGKPAMCCAIQPSALYALLNKQVTDKGIEILCDGVTAHSLYASGNPIGAIGAAFGELGRAMSKLHDTGRLVNLRSLSLSGCTEVTDHGISKLQSLTSLTHLDILGCWMVTGQGVAALASLSALESLSIEVVVGWSPKRCTCSMYATVWVLTQMDLLPDR